MVVSGCKKGNETTQTGTTETTESGVEATKEGSGEIENGSDFINKDVGCKFTLIGENWQYENTAKPYSKIIFRNTEQTIDSGVLVCSSRNCEVSKDEFEKDLWRDMPELVNAENYKEYEIIVGKSTNKQYKALEYSYNYIDIHNDNLFYKSAMFYADDEVYIFMMQSDDDGLDEISKTYEAVKDTFEVYK